MEELPIDPHIENTITMFNRIYLNGIPPIINDNSAFLSFITCLTATEALAGFRYADEPGPGTRFKTFIETYFPTGFRPYAAALWTFRNRMIHAFSPVGFSLTHHHSENHLSIGDNGNPILNAENFFAALSSAAQKYFAELRTDADLCKLMIARMAHDEYGGAIKIRTMAVGSGPARPDGFST